MKKVLAAVAAFAASSVMTFAEAQRSMLAYENRLPELSELEVGILTYRREFESGDSLLSVGAYGRYGLTDRFALEATVPYAEYTADAGGSDAGIGDISVGFQFLAYQDKAFLYPFIVPHASAQIGTGDEDKNLGSEDTAYTMGMTVGTKTWDVVTWMLDVSYVVNGGDSAPTDENQTIAAISLIWDVDEQLAFIGEGKMSFENSADDHPKFIGGGLSFKMTERSQLVLYGGAWNESEKNVDIVAKFSHTF